MRFARYLSLLFLPAFVFAADKPKGATKSAPPPEISKLLWLVGNWRMEKDNRLVDEQWMIPAGGLMMGMGRTVVKARATEHKFLQVREGPGGALFFISQVAGQKEAAYQIKTMAETAVAFENTEHDYPQRIIYALQPNGALLAAIEGNGPDGQPKRVEFLFRRL